MTFNASVPAVQPRTLIRAPQLNPILAVFRDAQAGDVLQGLGPGVVDFRPLVIDTTLPPGSDTGAWTLKTTGSGTTPAAMNGTYETPRDALVWLNDTNEAGSQSAALMVDFREDNATTPAARTGIHIKGYTRPDRGESSCLLALNTGGGSVLTAYKTHRMRPVGKPNLAYAFQGALEVGTDDCSFGALFQSGSGFPCSPDDPDPTLTGAINNVVTSIPVSDLAKIPPAGGAVVYPEGSAGVWPTPLHVRIGTEVISYTGRSAASGAGTLTGCVRGVNSTAAAHAAGDPVTYISANNAVMVRLGMPISKGIVITPADGSFDTRPALAIATVQHGLPHDTPAALVLRMNGNIESAGNIGATDGTFTGSLAATVQISSNQINAGGFSATGPATFASAETQGGAITPPQLTANTDNWNPTGLVGARVIRASTDASRNLTGIVAQSPGRLISLVNAGSFNLVLQNDVTSTAANRILTTGAAPLTLAPQGAANLWYDGGHSRWRILGWG